MDIETNIERLRKPTVPATEGDDIKLCAAKLFLHLKRANARGVAANQIGFDLSIFVMNQSKYTPICIVNPTLTRKKGQQKRKETCLSLPGVKVEVTRPQTVKVKGYNQYWMPVTYTFSGIEAACVCHEMDHLVGKLIVDYQEGGEYAQ